VIKVGLESINKPGVIPVGPWDTRATPGEGPVEGTVVYGNRSYAVIFLPEEHKREPRRRREQPEPEAE
jgi:hypothetical protein